MNIKLIDQFRNKVNEHGLVLHLYRNKNGKNQWSIICSAMDWISVVVEEIDISKLTFKNDNSSSVKVMTYISCIDVLWEAIQQLHRVFYHTSKIPYKDDDTIFKHKLFQSTDNEYFKTIRACFASHQVNLKDNFTGKGKNEQRYASWSGGFRDGHFSVFLYSNEPDIPDIPLSIYFDELQIFAEKRYDYLKKVMEEIDHQIKNYFEEQRKILIDKSKFVVNIPVRRSRLSGHKETA